MLEKIIVLEPRRLLRESLVRLLMANANSIEIVSADNVDDVMRVEPGDGTVALINGVDHDDYPDTLEDISRRAPGLPCVLLLTRPDPFAVAAALELGARGVVSATGPREAIVPILALAVQGVTYVPPEILAGVLGTIGAIGADAAAIRGEAPTGDSLTATQLSVLELVANGSSNRQISERLNMPENTVKAHVAQIMRKIGVRNRTELALLACQAGYAFTCPRARGLALQLASKGRPVA